MSTPPYSGCVWNYLKLTCDSLSKLLFWGKFRLRFGVTSKDFRSWDSAGCLASDRSAEPYIKIWICTAITIMVPSSLYTTICILWADTMGTTQCQDKLRCFKQTNTNLRPGKRVNKPTYFIFRVYRLTNWLWLFELSMIRFYSHLNSSIFRSNISLFVYVCLSHLK